MKGIKVGDKVSKYPIIQGGMGVGVSLHRLAGAVAKEGGIGILSTADIGFREPDFDASPEAADLRALKKEIQMAKEISPQGIIGVNIMCACSQYDQIVEESVKNKVDLIISGAGLPVKLPGLVKGSNTKIAPIVSSGRACELICRRWKKKYDYIPDLIIVEGPKAGGHLGFDPAELESRENSLENIVSDVLALTEKLQKEWGQEIPVIAAGGIFSAEDVTRFLQMGAAGVQLASRFVVTEECDASDEFKQAYIQAKSEDIVIIKSPVGMPGRAIRNAFVRITENYRKKIKHCTYCLKACKIETAQYCITEALIKSVSGNINDGLVFCGSNTDRIKGMTTVRRLLTELFCTQSMA